MTARATAPASSANLGPGFDVLAIAFELRCRVDAVPASSWSVTEEGKTYEPDPHSLILRAAAIAGSGPLAIHIVNPVPRTRGLGSSAALATAVAAAALRSGGQEPESDQLFEFVGGLEGHFDNAAAAVYGGCVVASDGRYRRLELDPGLVFVAGIPDRPLPTAKAREALQAEIDRAVVARSLGRVVFLVEGLRTGSATALAAAAGDELHEGPRAVLSPITGALMAGAYDAGALHAAWSGAGPSVLAICRDETVGAVRGAMADVLQDEGTVQVLEVARTGWS